MGNARNGDLAADGAQHIGGAVAVVGSGSVAAGCGHAAAVVPLVVVSTVNVHGAGRGAAGAQGGIVAVGQQDGVHLDIDKSCLFIAGALLDGCALDHIGIEFDNAGLTGAHNACVIGSRENRTIHD